jgi:dipeptidyl-peptidase-3
MPSAASINHSQFILPNDQPIVSLDAKAAFNGLTKREQLYSHYISRASFYGGLIVLVQTSPESPSIFRLLHGMNTAQKTKELKAAVLKAGVSEEDFTAYMVYCSGIYANMGNYKGFGDSKIIPNLPVEQFEALVKASASYAANPESFGALWDSLRCSMYVLTDRQKQLGLGSKGVSTYFSDNCDQEDSDKINKYFKEKNIEGYINRAFKTLSADGKVTYEIRNAAVESKVVSEEEFEGSMFKVTTGDYSPLMNLVCENLLKAAENAANDEERAMLADYVKSFREGSLGAHKDGSRHWIRNKGPAVETYIGFIETYRDPVGMRGEFEGFVAMVNRDQSAKFQALVDMAEEILPRLPWPKEFEKDTFLLPDFTSLDVLSFGGSGIPAGINIPNCECRKNRNVKVF